MSILEPYAAMAIPTTPKERKEFFKNVLQLMIRQHFHEFWMSESDLAEIEAEALLQMGLTYDDLVQQVEEGIAAGHSFGVQIAAIRKALADLKSP